MIVDSAVLAKYQILRTKKKTSNDEEEPTTRDDDFGGYLLPQSRKAPAGYRAQAMSGYRKFPEHFPRAKR